MLNLYELAALIKEELVIEVIHHNRFRVAFNNCEIKDSKSSNIIGTQSGGVGDSIDEAADDYFKKINKKWLVFGSLTNYRREYSANIYQAS